MRLVTGVTYIAAIIVTSLKPKKSERGGRMENDGQQDSLLRFGTQGEVFIGMRIKKVN